MRAAEEENVSHSLLIFANGTQVQLPDEAGDDIAARFAAYVNNPQPASRVLSVRYGDGGETSNRVVTVDLQSLICVLHR